MKKREKGSALYFSLIIMTVIFSIIVGLGAILTTQIRTIRDTGLSVPAFYIADAGIEEALFKIRNDKLMGSNFDFDGDIEGNSSYHYEVEILNSDDNPEECSAGYYCVRSIGFRNGIQRGIEATIDIEEPSEGEEWPETPPENPPSGLSSTDARDWAQEYCVNYFPDTGTSTLNGQVIYCDSYNNMWAPTLATTYQWSTENEDITTTYSIPNDCNEIPLGLEGLDKYPACKACVTLDYAGFSEGWRLPSHSDEDPTGSYCYPNSQLWKYGEELCQDKNWGIICNGYPGPDSCTPLWEGTKAKAVNYWSAIQKNDSSAWAFGFASAISFPFTSKNTRTRVRCFLGEW